MTAAFTSFARRALLAAATLTLAAPAYAVFPAGGQVAIHFTDSMLRYITRASFYEATDGHLLLVGSEQPGMSSYYRGTKLTREGEFSPGWTSTGTHLGYSISGYDFHNEEFTPDDSLGAWGWTVSSNVIHALPGGVVEPVSAGDFGSGWPTGLALSSGAVARGPGSDVFVIVSTKMQRMTRSGTRAAGWPSTGRTVIPFTGGGAVWYYPALLSDGAGGVFCLAANSGTAPLLLLRLDENGAQRPGWPAGGFVVNPNLQNMGVPPTRPLVRSGDDHVLVLEMMSDGITTSLGVHRVGDDGTNDPLWPAEGVGVAGTDSLTRPTMVSDGLGGAWVMWDAHRRQWATHVLANGTLAPGSLSAGKPLLPAGTTEAPRGYVDWILADRGLDGGLAHVWSTIEPDGKERVRARWLRSDMTPEPSEPDTGVVVASLSPYPGLAAPRAVLADGHGGLFVAWAKGPDLMWTKVSRPSFTGVTPRPTSPTLAFALASPNPAGGAVSFTIRLPDASPARLELFDPSGRRVRSATVAGEGEHVQGFGDLESLAPGLYLARLTHRGEARTARVVRVR